MGIVRKFIDHVVPGVARPMRILWNEIIGFVFFILAVWAVPSTIRNIRSFEANTDSVVKVGLSVGFAGLMIYFAISSFLRARRISRS